MVFLIARVEPDKIVIQEAITHWDIRSVLDQINPLLASKGYQPVFFFEGTPVIGQGGFSVIIKLGKPLNPDDKRLIKRIITSLGVRVIEVE